MDVRRSLYSRAKFVLCVGFGSLRAERYARLWLSDPPSPDLAFFGHTSGAALSSLILEPSSGLAIASGYSLAAFHNDFGHLWWRMMGLGTAGYAGTVALFVR